MNASSFRYLTKEGFRNVWTNRMMSIASICVLMSCLVLIGMAAMMFANIDTFLERIEEENVVMVFIKEDTSDDDIKKMESEINAVSNIKSVEFVPKDEAWNKQLETMDADDARLFQKISAKNPLPDAYKVTVANLDYFDQTVEQLNSLDNIDIIRENKDLAQKLVAIRQTISVAAIVIIAVLFLISLFIISNTIRLTVYSRRLEISIMKSVGATNSFVRLPFVVEGIILGCISGTVSLGIVFLFYQLISDKLEKSLLNEINLSLISFNDYALPMLAVFILIGIVCGVGGSLVTMSKYLNKEGSEISNV